MSRMRVQIPWVTTGLLLCCCSLGQGATIGVPGDQPTIQAGMDAASPGDTVLVASGVYRGPGNRDINFAGKNLVLMSQSGSGDTVIDCEGKDTGPHRAFCFMGATGATAVIRGFTMRNGYAEDVGGGIFCRYVALSLADCIITDCGANTGYGGYDASGGGMYCAYCALMVEDCVFSSNASGSWDVGRGTGGGVCCDDCSGVFRGCAFNGNYSGACGGGISAWGELAFTSCTFEGNQTGDGVLGDGGGFCGSAVFEDVTFEGNHADAWGGGVAGGGTFRNVTFIGNTAERSGGGLSGSGDLTVADAAFTSNRAYWVGGAIQCDGGVFERVVINDNEASFGGGISCTGDPTFKNVTLVHNSGDGDASGVCCWGGSPTFTQVIIAFGYYGEIDAVVCEGSAHPTFLCCDIYGNSGGDWVGCIADQYGLNGNISADPFFCSPGVGDFTLAAASPCAPANNSCGVLIGALDVDCNPTPVEGRSWGAIKAMFR
jgi:predicted outer membrane repeat protein